MVCDVKHLKHPTSDTFRRIQIETCGKLKSCRLYSVQCTCSRETNGSYEVVALLRKRRDGQKTDSLVAMFEPSVLLRMGEQGGSRAL